MAQTTVISTKELKRQAALAFEGRTLKVMLCELTGEFFTAESLVSEWQTVEKSGNGYVRFSEVLGTGSYSTTLGAYTIPTIVAEFTATAPYTYNTVVLYFNGETYVHSIVTENPNITLSTDQTQSYVININQDD